MIKETKIENQSVTTRGLSDILDKCFQLPGTWRHHIERMNNFQAVQRLIDFEFPEDDKGKVASNGIVEVKANVQFNLKIEMHRSLAYLLGLGEISEYIGSKTDIFTWFVSSVPGLPYTETHYYDILRPIVNFTIYSRYLFSKEEEICCKKFKAKDLSSFEKDDIFLTEFHVTEISSKKVPIARNDVTVAEFYMLSVLNDRITFDFAELTCFYYFNNKCT